MPVSARLQSPRQCLKGVGCSGRGASARSHDRQSEPAPPAMAVPLPAALGSPFLGSDVPLTLWQGTGRWPAQTWTPEICCCATGISLKSLIFSFGLPELTRFQARRGDNPSGQGCSAAWAIAFHPATLVLSPTARPGVPLPLIPQSYPVFLLKAPQNRDSCSNFSQYSALILFLR